MKERPILFSGPMVRAILEGKKEITRRVVKPQPEEWFSKIKHPSNIERFYRVGPNDSLTEMRCPYGVPGDRLWVRETWAALRLGYDIETGYCDDLMGCDPVQTKKYMHSNFSPLRPLYTIAYRATGNFEEDPEDRGFKWRPSIFMPRWASRLTLEVTDVRVERLQEISNEDAWNEGCTAYDDRDYWQDDPGGGVVLADTPRDEFQSLWNSINAKTYPWDSNPWVWVVVFKRV